MAERQPRGIDPDQFKTTPKEADRNAELFEAMSPTLRRVAEEFEGIMTRNPDFSSLKVHLAMPDGVSGDIEYQRGTSGIVFDVTGELGEKLPPYYGESQAAEFDGTFYYGASPTKPYAYTGDEVKKGQRIGWGFINKNTQGPVVSADDGVLTYAVENGTVVKKGDTIYYLKK